MLPRPLPTWVHVFIPEIVVPGREQTSKPWENDSVAKDNGDFSNALHQALDFILFTLHNNNPAGIQGDLCSLPGIKSFCFQPRGPEERVKFRAQNFPEALRGLCRGQGRRPTGCQETPSRRHEPS